MKTCAIGKSDLQSTRLIYGCMRTVGTWDPKDVNADRKATAKAAPPAAELEASLCHKELQSIGNDGCVRYRGQWLQVLPGLALPSVDRGTAGGGRGTVLLG